MARGSRGRGSRGAAGFPAGAQGSRTSFAQSGGVSNSFQGGKGGNAYGREATRNQVKARGTLNSGTGYKIREDGGDLTLVPGAHGGAGRLRLSTKGNRGKTNASIVTPHNLAPKGFGGGL